jgi:hypothetical protein
MNARLNFWHHTLGTVGDRLMLVRRRGGTDRPHHLARTTEADDVVASMVSIRMTDGGR